MSDSTTNDYRCACGRTGVKLWRLPHFANNALLCCDCVCEREGLDVSEMDATGRVPWRGMRTDQVGSWLPAVPVRGDEPGSFWGYTSVPELDVVWWCALPLRPSGSITGA